MAEFFYKGRSEAGELVSGTLHGGSADVVAGQLINIGITPVEIRDQESRATLSANDIWLRMGGGKPTTKDLIMFCRQMHTITRAGLPLLRGLSGLMETTHNKVLKAVLVDVLAGLESGRDLSQALAEHPRIFSRLFVSLVEIGEASGTLESSFERLYEFLSLDREVRDRVKSAVRYPLIVLMAAAIALAIITVFVIPNFEPIFRALGNDLPLPTRIIMVWGLVVARPDPGANQVVVAHDSRRVLSRLVNKRQRVQGPDARCINSEMKMGRRRSRVAAVSHRPDPVSR